MELEKPDLERRLDIVQRRLSSELHPKDRELWEGIYFNCLGALHRRIETYGDISTYAKYSLWIAEYREARK